MVLQPWLGETESSITDLIKTFKQLIKQFSTEIFHEACFCISHSIWSRNSKGRWCSPAMLSYQVYSHKHDMEVFLQLKYCFITSNASDGSNILICILHKSYICSSSLVLFWKFSGLLVLNSVLTLSLKFVNTHSTKCLWTSCHDIRPSGTSSHRCWPESLPF